MLDRAGMIAAQEGEVTREEFRIYAQRLRLREMYPGVQGVGYSAVLPAVTGRETEVLRLVGRGYSNDEIATTLTISAKTVKTHIGHLLAKLDARDRAQLVITAYETGLVAPRPRS